jgi:regulator of cell morphogenesis and NO signaling
MTPTTTTLADLAATSRQAVRVLEQHGLDYCCGGKQSFEQACRTRGLEPDPILREIDEATTASASGHNWQTASLEELVKHIVGTHHAYLKVELPALELRIRKVVEVHGVRDPQNLPRLAQVFAVLRSELETHLYKEEAILFPFIVQYSCAAQENRPMPPVPFGSIANPVAMMEREHAGAGDALEEIRSLTNQFELPSYACNTVKALYEGLKALEADLHVHIHLENNILFPRAIALEKP